ncbi:MAG: putative lipoprotein [Pseudomonas sp.]|nr:putative lipoprotein [Pseudomonas sp.]
MFKSFPVRVAGLALMLAVAAGCSSKKAAIYEHENFDDSGTFSRNYPVTDTQTCEAARRALLSQGYIITSSDPKLISGHKSFQQTGDTHMEISFSVVCADDGSEGHHATMFANALQDRYALKKTNNSASLGVGVLGSVSMPIGSSDDSMVKVASETVSSAKFYERFFTLVELFLPAEAKKAAHIVEKPKTDLGVPEAKAAPAALAPEPTPAAEPAPAPAAEPAPAPVSEPVAPPADAAPITPAENAEPAPATETITPPANPSDMAPPSEPIKSMP